MCSYIHLLEVTLRLAGAKHNIYIKCSTPSEFYQIWYSRNANKL